MSDVSVSLDTRGKETVTGAFAEVSESAKAMGEALMEHTKKLAEAYLGYESLVKVMETFKQAFELTGKLSELSDQTGISSDRLAILSRMFQNSGLSADDLGKVVNKLQKFIEGAGDAGSANAQKLAKLGLTFDDIKNLSPEEQFQTVAKALAGIQDPTEKAALAMEIFGKAGGKTLTLFNDWDEASAKATQQVGGLAEVLKTNAKTFEEVDDNLKALADKSVEFAVGIMEKALPALKSLTTYLSNIDATRFGEQFGDALAGAVDFALGIFKNPKDLFLPLGDALTLAFKTAVNAFDNGLVYVFDWLTNYSNQLIPHYGDLIKSEFTAAFGFVVSSFGSLLAEVFTGIAGYLPDKLGRPMAELGEKMRASSQEWADQASVGLADAWDKISTAAAKATEETHLQATDYMDAESTMEALKEHTDAVRENGVAFREQMEAANSFAESMPKFIDAMVGGAKTFRDYMEQSSAYQGSIFGKQSENNPFLGTSQNAALEDLKKMTGGRTPTQGIALPDAGGGSSGGSSGPAPAPIYQDQQLSGGIFNTKGLDSGMQADLSGASADIQNRAGSLFDSSIRRSQQLGAFANAASLQKQKLNFINDQAAAALDSAATRQAASDYTGEDGSSTSDALGQIKSKYLSEGYDPSTADSMAQQEFKDYVSKLKGPSGDGSGPGGSGGAQKSPQQQASDGISEILKYLRDTVALDKKLPLMALS